MEGFVTLRTFFRAEFRVPSALLRQSAAAASSLLEEADESGAIPVPRSISAGALATVIEYWKRRAEACAHGGDAAAADFDRAFAAGLSHDERVDLMDAAAKLGAQQLLDLFAAYYLCGEVQG